jgi:hypothetical protein
VRQVYSLAIPLTPAKRDSIPPTSFFSLPLVSRRVRITDLNLSGSLSLDGPLFPWRRGD